MEMKIEFEIDLNCLEMGVILDSATSPKSLLCIVALLLGLICYCV